MDVYITTDGCLCEDTSRGYWHSPGGWESRQVTIGGQNFRAYAVAGAHCVRLLHMNGGRVRAIRFKMIEAGIAHRVLAYY